MNNVEDEQFQRKQRDARDYGTTPIFFEPFPKNLASWRRVHSPQVRYSNWTSSQLGFSGNPEQNMPTYVSLEKKV